MEFISGSIGVVAIVDDDPSFRAALTGLVSAFGFHVTPFPSAEAFLDSDALTSVNCLISDVTMPGLGGLALYDHLKNAGVRVPTIFVSAEADAITRARTLARGALGCLAKPVDIDELRRLIEAAIPAGATARDGQSSTET
jgi:FixJ family two-component response regulator